MSAKKKQKKQNPVKILKWLIYAVIAIFLYFAYILFAPNITPESNKKSYLCIPDSTNFVGVTNLLNESAAITNMSAFKQVAALFNYGDKIKPGRYELRKGMNNFQLVRILRSGRQTPVRLTFNNIRTKEQLAGRLGLQLMADSTEILQLMNDSAFLAKYGLKPTTAIALFIPNTYEFFWNTNARGLFERMNKEYANFWTDERRTKAAEIPLTPLEVSTLASIVEEETNNKADRPMVAGLYINRLKINMPLQADPTLKFAVGDFSLKRVLLQHILYISPYNTYRNRGLPPGPIRVASEKGIDAVLDFSQHKYIYMCASESLNGEHKFATNWTEHVANAKRYQQRLNELKIYK